MKNVKDQVYEALLTVTENVSDTYPKDWANFPTIQYVEENNSVYERTDNTEQKAKVSYKIGIKNKIQTMPENMGFPLFYAGLRTLDILFRCD